RIMVGTLLDIGRGKIDKDSIRKILLSKSRNNAGVTVPGEGLYLVEVFYDGVF
ncbi:MAG: tRNA pseudouridine(38-40) synthase TruA, partial [Clostridia bacterium]|nr:tRNA pseudouridine(38-40) synthase TruA [Clostridia bacterium]